MDIKRPHANRHRILSPMMSPCPRRRTGNPPWRTWSPPAAVWAADPLS